MKVEELKKELEEIENKIMGDESNVPAHLMERRMELEELIEELQNKQLKEVACDEEEG